jgi:glycosyltransferase involved in cell wall biosynthesis
VLNIKSKKVSFQCSILFVHGGHELYGADRMLLLSLESVLKKYPSYKILIVLPKYGTLSNHIQINYPSVEILIREIGVLRKSDFKRLRFGAVLRIFTFFRLLKFMAGFDLVYISTIVVADYILAARFAKPRTLIHVHELPTGILLPLFSFLLSFSRVELIFVSEAVKQSFKKLKNQENYTIWNGCSSIQANYSMIQMRPVKVKLLMLGRISRGKGQTLLIEALSLLPSELKNKFEMRIVGDVYGKQQHLFVELQKQITLKNLDSQISLLPFTPEPEIHYNWSDVLIVPSILPESFGLVAIEAMSACKPVIAANHGGLTEIIIHNVTGLLFEPGNPKSLSEAITLIAQHPETMKKMGQAGRKRYEEHFTEEVYMLNFQKII